MRELGIRAGQKEDRRQPQIQIINGLWLKITSMGFLPFLNRISAGYLTLRTFTLMKGGST